MILSYRLLYQSTIKHIPRCAVTHSVKYLNLNAKSTAPDLIPHITV